MHGGNRTTERIDAALDARHVRVAEPDLHVLELPTQTAREALRPITQRMRFHLHGPWF